MHAWPPLLCKCAEGAFRIWGRGRRCRARVRDPSLRDLERKDIEEPVDAWTPGLEQRIWELERSRRRGPAALDAADRGNHTLELDLDIAEPALADLPWEALCAPDAQDQPGAPLVLHRCVCSTAG